MKKRMSVRLVLLVGIAAVVSAGAQAVEVGADDEFVIKDVPKAEVKQEAPKASEPQVKPRKCYKCLGSGKVDVTTREVCDRCEGTGIVVSEVELKDTIHHSGHYWWGGGYNERSSRKALNKQPCPRCKRQGKVAVKKEVECSTCRGSGWLRNGKPCLDYHPEEK